MIGLLLLIIFGLGGLGWWRMLQAKEEARAAAGIACREHGLVLMDDTVVLNRVRYVRSGEHAGWNLQYRFEFARNGVLHRGGTVLVVHGKHTTVVIRTSDGQIIEQR